MNEQALVFRSAATPLRPPAGEEFLHSAEQVYRRLLQSEPDRLRALCGLAVVRHQLGANAEARDLLGRAAAIAGPSAEGQAALGTAFRRINDIENARLHLEAAVRLDAEHREARLQLANLLCASGDVAGGVTQYEAVLALDPGNAEAHHNLGLALKRLGRQEAALAHCEATVRLRPKSPVAHISLADVLRHLGRYDDAMAEYRAALAVDPNLAEAHVNLGGSLMATGRHAEAIGCYQRALTINPGQPDAHYNLGNLYVELDNLDAAIGHYECSIELHPASAEAHNNLANALRKRGRDADAINHYEEAIRLKPNYAAAHRNLADALQAAGRFEEAVASFRTALTEQPNEPNLLNQLASALLVMGRVDEACRAYDAALAPDNIGILLNYASAKRFTERDARLARLQEIAGREATLSDEQRIALHFALGKAYADLGDGERSFQHLSIGNAIKRRYLSYDERGTLQQIERIRDTFTAERLQGRSRAGRRSELPVFVVGMPRSGTTLVEQILASHPRVFGAGELNDFTAAVSVFEKRAKTLYPELLDRLSDDDLQDLGKSYVERLTRHSAVHDRVVDKMPFNLLLLGLIHLALPGARIIHIRRDPVDTCLSCYSLLFAEGQPFAYDLTELGRYYRAYDGLMQHWRAVLPPGTMLEVQYEDLVKDVEGQARRMIAHCGLEWHDRCLAFYETDRPVQTASLVQVRKPIYGHAVGRSRLYGDRLKPLLDALDTGLLASGTEANSTIQEVQSGGAASAAAAPPRRAAPAMPHAPADRAYMLAKQLQERGEFAIAEPLFRFVLAARPDHYESLLAMGAICATTKRHDAAKSFLAQSIAANGSAGEAHGSLGAVHADLSEYDAAVACYERALALQPDHPGIHYAYAMVLQTLGRNGEAIDHLKQSVARRPVHLDSQFALGNLLYGSGQDIESAKCYLRVLQFNPRHPETHNNLANVLLRQGHPERAITYYRSAIEIKPDYADAYGNLGNALLELNRLEESIEQNRRALALKPERFGSYNNLGVAYQALGRFEEAIEAFERALELAPNEGPVHLNLANMKKFKPDDRRLPGLRRLMDNVDALDEEKRIAAHFAMGKALSDLKQYDEAFPHLLKANALKRTTFDYDEPQRLAMFENIETKFTPARLREKVVDGDASWSPIFIVGMPRSGTTLLEQVLASHSMVFGAGELETFKEAIGQCAATENVPPAYPELMTTVTAERIAEMGQVYARQVRAMAPDARYIVDKMPLNFMFVGLIHLALPNAKVIHIRRDPLDTCVSCFSLMFTGSQPFAYELGELGRYYRGYERVMGHWHRVLPPGVMIDVQYEALVDDLEGEARRVLAHCGLGWEDACRDFHDTKRAVRTASLMQVREPLYRSAMGGWRRYAKHLGPLAEALGGEELARLAEALS